jgi:hypothetical protein
VILSPKSYRQAGDSYFVTRHGKAPKEVYLPVVRDWLEPVTPANMPSDLGIAPNVMQIREPQGDVQVAVPDGTMNFVPATEGMPIPNGTVVRAGKDGTAAVLFGGIDSARLTPDSEMLVQQTVTPGLRTTRINLKSGTVFSKVGLRRGLRQDYQVETPHGTVAVKGTDFACMALTDRTEVWLAQGTVQFLQLDGQKAGTLHAKGPGALKLFRYPSIADARQALAASSATLTAAFQFIPKVNLKVKTLRDQVAQGIKLSPQEKKYLSLIKQIPCLVKLDLVEPPPVLAVEAPPARLAEPKVTSTPAPAAAAPPSLPAAAKSPAPLMSALPPPAPPPTSSSASATPASKSTEAPSSAPATDVPIAHGPDDTAP